MIHKNSRELNRYYQRIRILLPIHDVFAKKFLRDFKSSVEETLERSTYHTIEDVILHFGSPEQIAYDYIASIDSEHLFKTLHTRHYIKTIFTVIIVIILIFGLFRIWNLYQIHEELERGLIVREITVIE